MFGVAVLDKVKVTNHVEAVSVRAWGTAFAETSGGTEEVLAGPIIMKCGVVQM